MASFKDKLGREWVLELNIGTLATARKEADIPLGKLLAPDQGHALAELIFGVDVENLGRLLWVLCKEQAAKVAVDAEAFATLFNRETLDAARGALADAIADFTQSPKVAATLRARRPELMAAADAAAERLATARVEAALLSLASNGTAGS